MMDKCIFSGFPLDPADHFRGNQAWLDEKFDHESSRFLLYDRGRPLMDVSDGLQPAAKSAGDMGQIISKTNWRSMDWVFIGMDGETAFFAVEIGRQMPLETSEKFIDLRSVALQICANDFSEIPALLGRGKMLLDWQGRRNFCSCCGDKTTAANGGYLRKCVNQACAAEHFPRTDPVVIMFVVSGDDCLLGRGRGWPEGNFSALAGFVEPGETIEEATRRETREEAGIKIGQVSYVKSQPWPFPSSLMIGVRAEALSREITLDKNELVEAKWFDKAYLREIMESGDTANFKIPPKIAIARQLLDEWLQED